MVNLRIEEDTIEDVRLMIFDKDGTLMELHHYWTKMLELRAKLISKVLGLDNSQIKKIAYEMGADLDTGRLRPEGPVGLKKREIVMQAAVDYLVNLGLEDAYAVCFDVFKEVDDISSHDLRAFVRPIRGAEELVRKASCMGCRIAIATTDRRERAGLAMGFLGFGDAIDIIVGADDVSRPKPDPEQIEMILNTLGIAKSNAVMVGDALTDVQMGVNAGLKASIGVLTGFASHEELLRITPYIAADVSGIYVLES